MNPRHGVLLPLLLFFAATAAMTGCRVKIQNSEPIKTVSATPEEEKRAVESLKSFLAELDKENDQSWELLSTQLKSSTSKIAWSALVTAMKAACGKKLARGNGQGVCTESLPDSPPGRYFIFDFPTKFERADLTERIVLLLEDGQWKVAGYFRRKTVTLLGEPKKT